MAKIFAILAPKISQNYLPFLIDFCPKIIFSPVKNNFWGSKPPRLDFPEIMKIMIFHDLKNQT